jgi:putative serine protease PepD
VTWPRSLDLAADNPSGYDNPDGNDLAAQVDVLESAPPAATWRERRGVTVTAAAIVALVALVLTAIVAYHWGSAGSVAVPVRPSASPSASRTPTPADIYNTVAPSVVTIEAAHPDGSGDSGTGVIVNADGTVLTALHVVKGASAIRLTFADGTQAAAAVASSDPTRDIATLAPATLPSIVVPAVLGSSNRLAVGDPVVAIGNPLGLTLSTTTGVVSGLDRQTKNPDGTGLSGLIQFDAAVNPGSSGGPLLNGEGGVVGIVVALANPTSAGTFIGIGFAVPIGSALAGGGRPLQQ